MTQETQTIRSIHYLGSKLRLLEAIKDTLQKNVTKDGAICDLFAGSGTVSKYLLQYRDVISVDIQRYSQVLCEASMGKLENFPDVESVVREIYGQQTTRSLLKASEQLLTYERLCMERALNEDIAPLYEIVENGSIYILENQGCPELSFKLGSCMADCLSHIHDCIELDAADSMILRYYGGLYFSYKQAIDMDCIAHWIFAQSGLLHIKALAALLSTASDVVNTVGKQFAQPLKVRNAKGNLKVSLKAKIISDRSENVYEIFSKWLKYYFEAGDDTNRHTVICGDYVSALDKLQDFNIAAVYADPPYTRYHYSRYYHVLETICLRDNPLVSTTFPNGKGGISRAIYRVDRHQSPFCIKSKAEGAFDILFRKVRNLDVPLVLSYSPFDASKAVTPRLQTIDQLVEKAKVYFADVTIASPGKFTHSKLNSADKNHEANHEAELLIVCK